MAYVIERLYGRTHWFAVCSVEQGSLALDNVRMLLALLTEAHPDSSFRVTRGGNIVTTSERFER